MHTMHVKFNKPVMIKIDLSKAYDHVRWTYLWVILAKLGFAVNFITWVMSSLSSISFSLLINGVRLQLSLNLAGVLDRGALWHLFCFLLWLKV